MDDIILNILLPASLCKQNNGKFKNDDGNNTHNNNTSETTLAARTRNQRRNQQRSANNNINNNNNNNNSKNTASAAENHRIRIIESGLEQLWKIYLDESMSNQELTKAQKEFFLLGGHLAVVRTMQEFLDYSNIQDQAMAVLMHASYENSKLTKAIGRVQGVRVVINAMRVKQQAASYTKPNTTMSNGNRKNTNNRINARSTRANPVTPEYATYRQFMLDGFKVLYNLTYLYKTRHSKRLSNIRSHIPFLLGIFKEFDHDSEIMNYACNILWNLSHCQMLRKDLISAKAMSILTFVMETFPRDEEIQEATKETIVKLLS